MGLNLRQKHTVIARFRPKFSSFYLDNTCHLTSKYIVISGQVSKIGFQMTENIEPPRLFAGNGTEDYPAHPALTGGKCADCNHVFFPMQTYGCEVCGSENLEPKLLSGQGELIASAQVNMPAGKHRPAPFTIGSVKTKDGAFVRTILDVAPMTPLKNGISVVTCLVDEPRPDKGEKDLRFKPEDTGA